MLVFPIYPILETVFPLQRVAYTNELSIVPKASEDVTAESLFLRTISATADWLVRRQRPERVTSEELGNPSSQPKRPSLSTLYSKVSQTFG
jgi:hypothetical protein